MVEGRRKSRSYRRVYKKTPGARNVIHYLPRKPKVAHCGICGKRLQAVPRERPYRMAAMAKTKKRPERPYGGVLCSICSRQKIRQEAGQ
ncbi:MAG: 50S ribosomal protein L34e [Candidatus Woesearchaeota archaeon]